MKQILSKRTRAYIPKYHIALWSLEKRCLCSLLLLYTPILYINTRYYALAPGSRARLIKAIVLIEEHVSTTSYTLFGSYTQRPNISARALARSACTGLTLDGIEECSRQRHSIDDDTDWQKTSALTFWKTMSANVSPTEKKRANTIRQTFIYVLRCAAAGCQFLGLVKTQIRYRKTNRCITTVQAFSVFN